MLFRSTKKRVQLTNGNLVMQLDVPPKLIMPWKIEPEMQQTRYTAVTCDPDDFEKRGYFLRQNELGRTTELFIVITMYNVRLLRSGGGLAGADTACRKMRFCFVGRFMV